MTTSNGWALILLPFALLAALAALLAARLYARRYARERALNRIQAQAAARHAALIASASDAVLSVDGQHRILVFNPAAERLFGCTAGEVLGASFDRFIPESARERHAGLMAAFAAGDETSLAMGAGRDIQVQRADGRLVAVEITVSKVIEPGLPLAQRLYTVVLRDVSLRRAAYAELRRISERYRFLVEQSPDAIWLAEDGRLLVVNEACCMLLGARSAESLIGRNLSEFLPEHPHGLGAGDDTPGAPPRSEIRVRRLDGSTCEVELTVAELPDHDGRLTQGAMRDIAERRRAEAELRSTQQSLIEAQRLARLGYFSLDLAAGRWTTSPSLLELIGRPPGTSLRLGEEEDVIHPDDRAAFRAHLREVLLDAQRPFDLEYRIVRADDGQVRWLHGLGRIRTDGVGRPTQLFGSVQDITERTLATQTLERSREELRRLSAGLAHAREQERRHVARELHDELGQRLSALKLDLAALLARPAARNADLGQRLRAVVAAVDGAMAATRRIAADLRPAMLDDLGLSAALEWLAADLARRASLEIELDCEPVDESLTETATTTIYRVVQEALTNVTRHARATHARIELRRRGGELLVSIEDDGIGLAPGDTDKRSSSGLAGIRERARILGGSAHLDNLGTGGCRLEVRLPLDRVDSGVAEIPES